MKCTCEIVTKVYIQYYSSEKVTCTCEIVTKVYSTTAQKRWSVLVRLSPRYTVLQLRKGDVYLWDCHQGIQYYSTEKISVLVRLSPRYIYTVLQHRKDEVYLCDCHQGICEIVTRVYSTTGQKRWSVLVRLSPRMLNTGGCSVVVEWTTLWVWPCTNNFWQPCFSQIN